MELTIGQIVSATKGVLKRGDETTLVTHVGTDTRTLHAKEMYVGLKGETFDGNTFTEQALEKGAFGVLTSRTDLDASAPGNGFIIAVEDTTRALGLMARAWRRIVSPMVVAITGSSGKTTTKDMAAHLCRGEMEILATEGNKNNHIGLPLTLIGLERKHETAIVELGMNHSGELRALTGIADPSIGVLTNIGDAHLGNFANIEELRMAKSELFATMKRSTTAVINADCPNSQKLRERQVLPWEVIEFGETHDAQVRATNVRPAKPFGYEFDLRFFQYKKLSARIQVFGHYQIQNVLAAATVALLLGVPPETIAERLGTFEAPRMRSNLRELGGVRVIEDCYNASPSAMIASIYSFAELECTGRRFVLLGDMYELGDFAESQHRRVGAAAASPKIHHTFCVGAQARWIAEEAEKHGATALHFETIEDAVTALLETLQPGDSILVKGSRRARLERAADLLAKELQPHPPQETVL